MSENLDNNTSPPTKSLEEIVAEAKASAARKAASRTAKRAELDQVRAEPKLHLVAWVDLLGFREQLNQADTPEKFQALFQRVRMVHEEFDKPSASVESDQEEVNAGQGKTIVAVSDALVIALNLEDDCPAAEVSGLYDRIATFLASLQLAQARCASVGNLVRGGIALGSFCFKNDIMLSRAMAEAHTMETKLASNPVIILRRELVEELKKMVVGEGWEEGFDPMANLFRDCEWMKEPERSEHVMLNIMPMFLDDADPAPFVKRYYRDLFTGREAAPDVAKPKYDWLIQYLREFVSAELPSLEETIFGSLPSGAVALDAEENLGQTGLEQS